MSRLDQAHARRLRSAAVLGLIAALAGSGCTGPADTSSAAAIHKAAAPTSPLPTVPPAQPPPRLTRAKVDAAVDQLDGVVQDAMRRTGVPGVAVAVVHDNEVVYLKGFGVTEGRRGGQVGPDTVFQLASLSKPVASTVVAAAVGDKTVAWDDPVVEHRPGFALKDPWVDRPRHARRPVLAPQRPARPRRRPPGGPRLRPRRTSWATCGYEPLAPFRASYAYTNFGVTAAAVGRRRGPAGTSWEKLSADTLYQPLGMDSTSSRFADYEKANEQGRHPCEDRATPGRPSSYGTPTPSPRRAVSAPPSGDMTQLAAAAARRTAEFDGRQVVDADALDETHLPADRLRAAARAGGQRPASTGSAGT